MLVSHTIQSIDTSTGGPARSVTHLVSHLAALDDRLHVSLNTGHTPDAIIKEFEAHNAHLNFCNFNRIKGFKNFKTQLTKQTPQLLHGHGMWQMPVHQMARYAQKHQLPYLITPRGMLEPWSLEQKPLQKQVALKLYQANDLAQAACIHATAKMEADNIRALGFKNPIAVIPNGISLNAYPLKQASAKTGPKTLLFLSRIHPKKGIELLIEAWAAIAPELKQNWQVQIVGNSELNYLQQLNQLIEDKGQSDQMRIEPPRYGDDKVKVYQNADIFVLPTYSENFGVVIAEAMACGTPVITTHGAPWQDLERHDCGWWIPTEMEALKHTLENAIQLPDATLLEMGRKGRQLIERSYSITAVAKKMLVLYRWILGEDEKPEFVYLE